MPFRRDFMEDNSRWFQEFEEYNATFVCKENLGFISIRRERRFNQRILCEGTVNAGAKMRRLAGAKIHRRCWQEGPELGAFSSGIRLGSDYPPRRQHWRGVNGAYFD